MRLFYRFGKRRKRCKYRRIRVFPACLVSTIFVAQNAVCNGFGCGLGGRAGEHHEHQLGVCGPMGGLRWAVFRAPQYERACIADIKHQSYCCRTWFWGRFEAVPMAPKHERNTTGDHNAADARVRRARALYASSGGERQSERRRPCRPLPPGPTILMGASIIRIGFLGCSIP